MGTVTIAATYGAGGSLVAPKLAERLGLPLIDRALPRGQIAQIASLLDAEMRADDELHENRVMSILSRVMSVSGLWVGVPVAPEELGVDDRVIATEAVLKAKADAEGAVILGRAGVFVLAGRPDVLHVRLDGPREARVKQSMRITQTDAVTARRQQEENDTARRAYIHHFYPRERWEDPNHYHLWLDGTALDTDAMVEIVAAAAGARFARKATVPD